MSRRKNLVRQRWAGDCQTGRPAINRQQLTPNRHTPNLILNSTKTVVSPMERTEYRRAVRGKGAEDKRGLAHMGVARECRPQELRAAGAWGAAKTRKQSAVCEGGWPPGCRCTFGPLPLATPAWSLTRVLHYIGAEATCMTPKSLPQPRTRMPGGIRKRRFTNAVDMCNCVCGWWVCRSRTCYGMGWSIARNHPPHFCTTVWPWG